MKLEYQKGLLFCSLIILSLVFIAGCSNLKLAYRYYINPCYYDTPIKQKDFPQHFLAVNIEEYYQKVHSLASNFTVDTIENISYDNKKYPIVSIENNNIKSKKKLLIFAGVHGNESGGTLAILAFLEDLGKDTLKAIDWNIKVIVPVNPIGTIAMSRYNENGCDLNRKVKSSKQKGILIQRKVIEDFNPDILISLHEAPSEGFLIHPGKHLSEGLRHKILQDIESKGVQLAKTDYLGRDLKVKGLSEVKGMLNFLKKLVRVQSLGDYLKDRDIIEITTESGWNSKDTFQRITSHNILIHSVLEQFEK